MGKVSRNNLLQVIARRANFDRQVVVWQRVFNSLCEQVHPRRWAPGDLWHVPSVTSVLITLAKFNLMGCSWLMDAKGWRNGEGDTVPKCDFFKCHQS